MTKALYEFMNITQVYLTPDYDTSDNSFRVKYQNDTTYIQLYVEECLRKNKVDIGAFNRLVFSEGGDSKEDFIIVGNNALPVAIDESYDELSTLKSDLEFHNYYVRKFLDGFSKFDAHYESKFKDYLEPLIKDKYKDSLHFDKKMATKRVGHLRLQVVGRFTREKFTLNVFVFNKKEMIKSQVIFECEPDMFIVKFDAYKVEIDDDKVRVINKVDEITLERDLAEFI